MEKFKKKTNGWIPKKVGYRCTYSFTDRVHKTSP